MGQKKSGKRQPGLHASRTLSPNRVEKILAWEARKTEQARLNANKKKKVKPATAEAYVLKRLVLVAEHEKQKSKLGRSVLDILDRYSIKTLGKLGVSVVEKIPVSLLISNGHVGSAEELKKRLEEVAALFEPPSLSVSAVSARLLISSAGGMRNNNYLALNFDDDASDQLTDEVRLGYENLDTYRLYPRELKKIQPCPHLTLARTTYATAESAKSALNESDSFPLPLTLGSPTLMPVELRFQDPNENIQAYIEATAQEQATALE